MSEYERGYQDGKADAQRDLNPKGKKVLSTSENYSRGYWDGWVTGGGKKE